MIEQDKQLLLRDLCARLPYGVIYHRNDGANIELYAIDINNGTLNYTDNIVVRECKPYLRSISSMTEEERKEYFNSYDWEYFEGGTPFDWLNAHHFDYRGLIPMGLALEALKAMYKTD